MNATYIIAEAGVNHNGSLEAAYQLVEAAAAAGADAVKFQTFKAENIVSRVAPKARYQLDTTDITESQLDMVRALELSEANHKRLRERCGALEIDFLSSPFDLPSLRLLSDLGVPRLKVASGEITNGPLLLAVARQRKPVILSTGMCLLGDIEMALAILAYGLRSGTDEPPNVDALQEAYSSSEGRDALKEYVSLLHCTTEYPAPLAEVELRSIETLRSAFDLSVGYSDHTSGITIPIAAVALGAEIIEKHLTLDRNLPGPDHRASLEPYDFAAMVKAIREVDQALGSGRKAPTRSELGNARVARKSLVAARPIRQGTALTKEDVAVKRPGTGISPLRFWEILGRTADRDYETDELLSWPGEPRTEANETNPSGVRT